MTYSQVQDSLRSSPRAWLVTGAAGFIGSHVVEKLLSLGQRVRVLDNYYSSTPKNLDLVRSIVGSAATNLQFVQGDIEALLDALHAEDQAERLAQLENS